MRLTRNFYANLMRASDRYLVELLDRLEETGLLDSTLIIRTADHGEMGLAHGGLREQNFNFYEESLRVPLVPGAEPRRVHLRRLAVRSAQGAVSESAQPHRHRLKRLLPHI
jgi:arylsulfatase A-like enzyme